LFLLETDLSAWPASKLANCRSPAARHVEYYWLCNQCANVLTLLYEKGRGIVTVARMSAVRKPPTAALQVAGRIQTSAGRTGHSA
jgi:hypothetical protein